jgi:type VI secretion system secreted protein Hcp
MAQNDIFLDLKGIPGESKDADKDFNEKIQLESFSFNCHVPRDVATHQPVGRRQHAPLTCVKRADKATALILAALFRNQKIDTGKLSVRKAGGGQKAYFVIDLEEVYVASHSVNADSGDKSTIPLETFQLVYGKITVTYKEQSDLGILSGGTVAADDLRSTQ